VPAGGIDEQRLAFGKVAELYDRARPSYPAKTIDALFELAQLQPGAEVLEVGAGTGKATRLLADRGVAVTALEPDPAMAAVARRKCAGYQNVEIEQTTFEAWQPRERVQAVVAVQAWHWIDPKVRCERAAAALHEKAGWPRYGPSPTGPRRPFATSSELPTRGPHPASPRTSQYNCSVTIPRTAA